LTSISPLDPTAQVRTTRRFYKPLLEQLYDNPDPRLRDLEQLELLAARFADRRSMLAELALDPPTTTSEFDEHPDSDDDYVILSTVHSAKGLEWDTVYTLSVSDGVFPLHRASTSREQIEEERRLFYVALTRAKNSLFVCFPQKTFQGYRGGFGDPHGFAKLSRFITKNVQRRFRNATVDVFYEQDSIDESTSPASLRSIRKRTRSMWS
jgi:DNA helicase-2/ATP-dependent DNA helicase PcrA